MRRVFTGLLSIIVLASLAAPASAQVVDNHPALDAAPAADVPPVLTPQADPFDFEPLSPARLLDTRRGGATIDGAMVGGGALGPAAVLDLPVLGRGGVPTRNVAAVVLNVTGIEPTSPTFITVFPSGQGRPNASNLNLVPGQVVPNLVVAALGSAGRISIFNERGSINVLADVVGWYPTASALQTLSPSRLLDTRPGGVTIDGVAAAGGSMGPNSSLSLQITGRAGLPSTGVGTVLLNVTATSPSTTSFVTVWPAGATRPNASNLNFTGGVTRPNLVAVRVGLAGRVSLFNESGNVHLIADIVGWFAPDEGLRSLVPARVHDSRPGGVTIDGLAQASGPIGEDVIRSIRIAGRGGVPASGAGSVVVNVTAVEPTKGGFLTIFPRGEDLPNASNLNFTAGLTIPNLVVAKLSIDGWISVYNPFGATHVIIDVVGWYPFTHEAEFDPFTLPPAIEGTAYSFAIPIVGSRGPYTVTAPTLPPGLTLAGGGVLSGTPTRAGTFTIPVTLVDDFGRSSTDEVQLTVYPATAGIVAVPPAVIYPISTPPLAAGATATIPVLGVAGVPASGVAGVHLEVTIVGAANGFVIVHPAGASPGLFVSEVGLGPDTLSFNTTVVAPGTGGAVAVYNGGTTALSVHVRVLGYMPTSGGVQLVPHDRFVNTAAGEPATSVTGTLPPVPGATHALIQMSHLGTSRVRLTAYASDATKPALTTTDLRPSPQVSFALVPLGPGGTIRIDSEDGPVRFLADVIGYVVAPPPPP